MAWCMCGAKAVSEQHCGTEVAPDYKGLVAADVAGLAV
jgi:hypothetical protein